MTEHLSLDQLGRLSQHQIKGVELLDALDHVEECEECRQKIESPTKAEILTSLFSDYKPMEENNESENLKSKCLSKKTLQSN